MTTTQNERPDTSQDVLLTDGGLETSLIFLQGVDLPILSLVDGNDIDLDQEARALQPRGATDEERRSQPSRQQRGRMDGPGLVPEERQAHAAALALIDEQADRRAALKHPHHLAQIALTFGDQPGARGRPAHLAQ